MPQYHPSCWPTEDIPREENSEDQTWHAYFSQKQKDTNPGQNWKGVKQPISNIYLNENGEEVEITEVSTKVKSSRLFNDMIYRGIVVKWHYSIYR